MVEQRKRYFQRGPGQGAYHMKRRKMAKNSDIKDDVPNPTVDEEGNHISAADAFENGLHDVPPPSNQAPLTKESGLDAVQSLWRIPYVNQLRKKRGTVVKSLRRALRDTQAIFSRHNKDVAKAALDKGEDIPEKVLWNDTLLYAKTEGKGLICPVSAVYESPDLDGYRNKNEFSLGINLDGQKTAGFQIGRYTDGESRIGEVEGCRTAPPVALEVANLVTKFIRASEYDVWDKAHHKGFFRLVIVRNSKSLGQLMVVLQVDPNSIDGGVDGELFANFKKEFKEFFVNECFGGELSDELAKSQGLILPSKLPGFEDLTNTPVSDRGAEFSKKYAHSLTSLGIQIHDGVSNAASDVAPVIQVFGQKSIFDVIAGLTFRVDLNSFFQVNNKGAELLYKKAAQWALAPPHDFNMPYDAILERYATYSPEMKAFWTARHSEESLKFKKTRVEKEEDDEDVEGEEKSLDTTQIVDENITRAYTVERFSKQHNYPVEPLPEHPDPEHAKRTLLLDICCGTGTIGLIMSKDVHKVVGLELVPAAIEDAKFNASLNNITNASFVCGKAEDTIKSVLMANEKNLEMAVGIVDPPRSGLHNDVIRALRASKLNRIVYVSCNSATLADNVTRLCTPVSKKYVGEPFVPIASICVDMFPHTPHCEVVMLLERKPKSPTGAESIS